MSEVLITAGNIRENSFNGVCYAVSQMTVDIKVIHILDTEVSALKAEECKRNQSIRRYLGNVEIRSSVITDHDIQQKIPTIISSLIREFSINNVYVDLSNGQKILTGVLYAVATISQIPNIYAIELRPGLDLSKNLQDFTKNEDWKYVSIKPLSEIKNISQSSQIELIYYRDNIQEVINLLERIDRRFALDSRYRLENSLTDYFSALVISDDEKKLDLLERCVNGLGKICEDVAFRAIEVFYSNELIDRNDFKDFNDCINRIYGTLNEIKNPKKNNELKKYPEGIYFLLALGEQLKMMQVYRNFSSHSDRRYKFNQRDARLALDVTLLILERIGNNIMFQNRDVASPELV
jgi:hypothetical protein